MTPWDWLAPSTASRTRVSYTGRRGGALVVESRLSCHAIRLTTCISTGPITWVRARRPERRPSFRQNLRKLEIAAAIEKAIAGRAERAELTADLVVDELRKIAFARPQGCRARRRACRGV
jgi:hypothetical protein